MEGGREVGREGEREEGKLTRNTYTNPILISLSLAATAVVGFCGEDLFGDFFPTRGSKFTNSDSRMRALGWRRQGRLVDQLQYESRTYSVRIGRHPLQKINIKLSSCV